MLKQKKTPLLSKFGRGTRSLALLLVAAGVLGGAVVVHADQYDAQIQALQAQNANVKGLLNGLASQADSFQAVINNLQVQINAVQTQLAANQVEQANLQQKITENENLITQKKAQLSATIKAMYIDGQASTIEELATSKSLSEYVDKEEYRSAVQKQLNDTIVQINQIQAELQKQKINLDSLIASQKTQNEQLVAAQNQQAQMLAYNEGQQSAYNSQLAANSSQIAELRRLQIIANGRYNIGDFKGDPGNGGYPGAWANAPQDSLIDSWGMYNRECVSYTAYKVHQDYLAGKNTRDMPWWGGIGNANQWDDNARAMGIPVDNNPTPGSIAISNAGFYGHAMYVEAVNGNQIYIQQYNQQLNGQYSEGWRYTTGLVFIHF